LEKRRLLATVGRPGNAVHTMTLARRALDEPASPCRLAIGISHSNCQGSRQQLLYLGLNKNTGLEGNNWLSL